MSELPPSQGPVEPEPTALYRAYDDAGRLLYVGIARNWGRRWAQHSSRAPWYGEVTRLEVEMHPDRLTAAAAELAAIADEHPIHNVIGTRGLNRRTEQMPEPPRDPTDRLSLAVGSFTPTSLVGSFFHSGFERGWQGCVVAEPAPGVYLVETFSWMMGESYDQHLVPITGMVAEEWRFYDTADWMRESSEAIRGIWAREREERAQADRSR